MINNFNIHDITLNDESCMIKQGDSDSPSNELNKIRHELIQLKEDSKDKDSDIYHAIEDLQRAIEKGSKPDIASAIKMHIKEFTMPLFTNVASQTLLGLIDSLR